MVDSLGKQVPKWASPQALYHVVRDCVVHLLRHLIRSVDPAITKVEFAVVDERTLQVEARILNTSPQELAEHVVSSRMTLPMRFQGLALTSLVESADSAYVGAVHGVAGRLLSKNSNLVPTDISGFVPAVERLQHLLNSENEVVPSARDILEGANVDCQVGSDDLETDSAEEPGKRKKFKALGWKLQNALFARARDTSFPRARTLRRTTRTRT